MGIYKKGYMKLKKLIKKINKENAPPDGWKPEDKIKKACVERWMRQASEVTKQENEREANVKKRS